jgi:hypothetical protein
MDVPQADNVRHNVDVATVDVSVQTVEPVESDSAEVAQIARTQIAVTNRTGGMQMRTATRRTTRRKPVDSMVHSDCNAESCKVPRVKSPTLGTQAMKQDNANVLGQDERNVWQNGVRRFSVQSLRATQLLSWVIDHTSRKLSVIITDEVSLDGFHNWDAVHAGFLNDERQLQHTFVISRAQRRRALKHIPGLASIVDTAKAAIKQMQLHDTPGTLEWLTGHILNQGDVNARFEYHQDTNEERKEMGGRRDRCVLYTTIVKLNRGGCTSMRVLGQPEVFYHTAAGSGVIFRSDLHHRTEKAEPGIWKLALFFGVFL